MRLSRFFLLLVAVMMIAGSVTYALLPNEPTPKEVIGTIARWDDGTWALVIPRIGADIRSKDINGAIEEACRPETTVKSMLVSVDSQIAELEKERARLEKIQAGFQHVTELRGRMERSTKLFTEDGVISRMFGARPKQIDYRFDGRANIGTWVTLEK